MSEIVGRVVPEMCQILRFSIPYTTHLLKNHVLTMSRRGGRNFVFLRKETRTAQEYISWTVRAAGLKWKHNKVWIDIYSEKPDHKSGDAINLVDRICDAIKVAIEVDDRWFCIRYVDWTIKKQDPKIYIGISQEDCEDSQVCRFCGGILSFEEFSISRYALHGRSRSCKKCEKQKRFDRRIQTGSEVMFVGIEP